jgi:NADPH:quinone reductase-like Zn-dependent oxidoreductase
MKAVRFHKHGGPEVLMYEDAPDPLPNADEALVRVRACALNHLDLWGRNGLPNVEIPMPHISGSDVSGVVEWVPEEEKEFRRGDEVVMNPGVSCGRCEKCLLGLDDQCRFYNIIGYRTDGGYAELVKIPRTNLVRKPPGMSFEEAASFPLVFLTAYHMLVTKARVRAGEKVLVIAAGSGVGGIAGGAAGHAGMGVGIGAAAGAAAGLASVLLTRGPDLVLPKGTSFQMVLDRNLRFKPAELHF